MDTTTPFRLSAILKGLCPACHRGPVLHYVFGIHDRCSVCNYNFKPEPGFYLGAMMVSFLLAAMLIIPPLIVLKVLNVEMIVLMVFPFVEFLFVGPLLVVYSRLFWLHLEYRMTRRLDKE
jgi:uncharacterized protein (DUF983 family)